MFANPEDAKDVPGSKVGSDPDVERVRRAHLNDLENIPLFIAIAAVYMVAVQVNQLKINMSKFYYNLCSQFINSSLMSLIFVHHYFSRQWRLPGSCSMALLLPDSFTPTCT